MKVFKIVAVFCGLISINGMTQGLLIMLTYAQVNAKSRLHGVSLAKTKLVQLLYIEPFCSDLLLSFLQ